MNTHLEFDALLAPLFDVLPLSHAMPALLPAHPAYREALDAVRTLVVADAFRDNPSAQAALWLYVDELDSSHSISQSIHSATGSFLHGIMHRREGDFFNSHYWMRRAESHPVWRQIPDYNPGTFIDAVAAARSTNPAELLELQRLEWRALMTHCLGHPEP